MMMMMHDNYTDMYACLWQFILRPFNQMENKIIKTFEENY